MPTEAAASAVSFGWLVRKGAAAVALLLAHSECSAT